MWWRGQGREAGREERWADWQQSAAAALTAADKRGVLDSSCAWAAQPV